jgi:hypothetical protein
MYCQIQTHLCIKHKVQTGINYMQLMRLCCWCLADFESFLDVQFLDIKKFEYHNTLVALTQIILFFVLLIFSGKQNLC